METLAFILAGIGLYVVADRLLQRLEVAAGRRFEYRSLIFFALMLGLALVTFPLLRLLLAG